MVGNPTTYRHIVVHGTPHERGLSHGTQAKDLIVNNVTYYKQPGKLMEWSHAHRLIHDFYIPGLKAYFPAALEEMAGIAIGAGVSLDDILMLNARYDLSRFKSGSSSSSTLSSPPPSECTSAIFLSQITADNSVVTAQNWDMSANLYDSNGVIYLEIHPDPSEGLPSMFITTEAGQLFRSGMNSSGLGITANSLESSWDYNPLESFSSKPLMPASVARRLFLHHSNFSAALKAIATCPVHVSNNVMLSTAENFGICLEITPKKIFRIPVPSGGGSPSGNTKGYLTHANHFAHHAFLASDDVVDTYKGGSSWYRADRLAAEVENAVASSGALAERDLVNAFKDHLGYPRSICEHVDDSLVTKGPRPSGLFKKSTEKEGPYSGPQCTVAFVLYNLTSQTVKVCKGPPCQGEFQTFVLKQHT